MLVFLTMAPPEWVGFWMAKRNFSDEQIAFALRQAWSGTSVAEVIRRLGISDADLLPMEEAVCWAWRCRVATATDLGGGDQKLKQLVADLSLDKKMLQDVLSKKL
jgi:putative transposase